MKILSTNRIGQALLILGFGISAPSVFGAVITSGSIQITGSPSTSGTFTLSGSDFTATGAFSDGNWGPQCIFCNPIPVAGFESGLDLRTGSGTIGLTTFPNVNWSDPNPIGVSVFNITGPPISLNSGPGTYVGSFSFTGSLCGVDPNAHLIPNPCIVDLPQLTGSGQVSVTVVLQLGPEGENELRATGATYTFVPEPSSMVLLGSALILLAMRAFQKQSR